MKQGQRKNGGIAAVLKSFNTQAILQMCDFQIVLLQKSLKDFPFIIFDFFFKWLHTHESTEMNTTEFTDTERMTNRDASSCRVAGPGSM